MRGRTLPSTDLSRWAVDPEEGSRPVRPRPERLVDPPPLALDVTVWRANDETGMSRVGRVQRHEVPAIESQDRPLLAGRERQDLCVGYRTIGLPRVECRK